MALIIFNLLEVPATLQLFFYKWLINVLIYYCLGANKNEMCEAVQHPETFKENQKLFDSHLALFGRNFFIGMPNQMHPE